MYRTMIRLKVGSTTEGTVNDRPVTFSQALWCWLYADTPADRVVERVENPQTYRPTK